MHKRVQGIVKLPEAGCGCMYAAPLGRVAKVHPILSVAVCFNHHHDLKWPGLIIKDPYSQIMSAQFGEFPCAAPHTTPPLVQQPVHNMLSQSHGLGPTVASVCCTLICADESSLSLPKYGAHVAAAPDPIP